MKIILVDDTPRTLNELYDICSKQENVEIAGKFTDSFEALEYAKNNYIELAMLDIDMPSMNGIELSQALRQLYKDIVIVFVTSHPGYAQEAFKKTADYIVFKPFFENEVIKALSLSGLLCKRQKKRVTFHTFGVFSMRVEGEPVIFTSSKAKELLALCVFFDGSPVSASETRIRLWEDYDGSVANCSIYRMTVKRLIEDLEKYGVSDIFVRDSKSCRIDRDKVDSDYASFLRGEKNAICEFQGEFMSEYSWAESKIYSLQEKKDLLKSNV